jgi:hypothetical protein
MGVPRQRPKFTPVVMIPESERTPTDLLAIAQVVEMQKIVALTMDTERSRQTKIGVSEFGDPCRKCVARKLAQSEALKDPNWKAQMGTFGHNGMESHFPELFPWMYDEVWLPPLNPEDPHARPRVKYEVKPELVATDEQPLYHLERRVTVGTIDRHDFLLDGSCDLFIEGASFGIVQDWKFQGASSLKKSGTGNIGPKYHTQMNGYGRGYENLGKLVTHVLLYALPRDDELEAARPVLMRYDRDMAIRALDQLGHLMDAAKVLGWEALIESLPSDSGCWDCPRYAKAEQASAVRSLVGAA